jgi:hypothetical protein
MHRTKSQSVFAALQKNFGEIFTAGFNARVTAFP